MTTLNPLGLQTFRVNVYQENDGVRYGLCLWAVGPLETRALYRLKVTPWIPHDGGPCPVGPNVMVKVKTRNEWVCSGPGRRAGFWMAEMPGEGDWWVHEGRGVDIIAYQIVE